MIRITVIFLMVVVCCLACHEPIQAVIESRFLTGATGGAGETGVSGTDGVTGESGTTGPLGETGTPGVEGTTGDAACLNSSPPDFEVEISSTEIAVGQTYTIGLKVHDPAFDSALYSYGLEGAGGNLEQNGHIFTFVPVMCGGPYHFTAWVRDPCHTSIKHFTIPFIKPGWLTLGDVGGIASEIPNNIALSISDGTPYVAFNSSQGIKIKQYNGVEWINLLDPNEAGINISIIADKGVLYLAFQHDIGGVHFKRYHSGSWSSLGNIDSYTLPSIFVYNGTPLITHRDSVHKTHVHFHNGTSLVEIKEFGTQPFFAPLSVWNGTVYVAYKEGGLYLKTFTIEPDSTGNAYPDFGRDGNLFTHSLFVEEGTPYMAFTKVNEPNYCSVMKNGSTGWEFIGTESVSTEPVKDHLSLAVYQGTPYVAFQVSTFSDSKIWVYQYTGFGTSQWEVLGSSFNGSGPGFVLYHGTPYLAYQDLQQRVFVSKYVRCD